MKFKLIEKFSIIIKDFKSNTESRNSVNVSPCASLFVSCPIVAPSVMALKSTEHIWFTWPAALLSFSVKKKKVSGMSWSDQKPLPRNHLGSATQQNSPEWGLWTKAWSIPVSLTLWRIVCRDLRFRVILLPLRESVSCLYVLFINNTFQCSSLIANGIYESLEHRILNMKNFPNPWFLCFRNICYNYRLKIWKKKKKKSWPSFQLKFFCHCVHRKLAKGKPFIGMWLCVAKQYWI